MTAYGARAERSTLLSFVETNPETTPCIASKGLLIQDRITRGTHIPVASVSHTQEKGRPRRALLLA